MPRRLHACTLGDGARCSIDRRLALRDQARKIIHAENNIPEDAVGRGEVDRILADLQYRLIKKLDEKELAAAASLPRIVDEA